MNYKEAKELAEAWTKDIDPRMDGWRSAMSLLLLRIHGLEDALDEMRRYSDKLQRENEALALDLGLKDLSYTLPPQPQLKTIADIIRECEGKN
jgi:protoheme ferro-lyase